MFARVMVKLRRAVFYFACGIGLAVLPTMAVEQPATTVVINIQRDGSVEIEGTLYPVDENLDGIIIELVNRTPQPQVRVQADSDVEFEKIGAVMLVMQRTGVLRVGFITDPAPQPSSE